MIQLSLTSTGQRGNLTVQKPTCTPTFPAALITLAKKRESTPRVHSRTDVVKKLWCVYTVEHDSHEAG